MRDIGECVLKGLDAFVAGTSLQALALSTVSRNMSGVTGVRCDRIVALHNFVLWDNFYHILDLFPLAIEAIKRERKRGKETKEIVGSYFETLEAKIAAFAIFFVPLPAASPPRVERKAKW